MIHLKKIGFGLLAVVLLLCSVSFPKTASADEFDLNSIYEPYFILVDADQPTVALDGLEREADKQVEPASTTKVLSCIVAIEETLKNGKSLNDLVTVSENAVDFGKGNSLMELEAGDTFPLIDLLYREEDADPEIRELKQEIELKKGVLQRRRARLPKL